MFDVAELLITDFIYHTLNTYNNLFSCFICLFTSIPHYVLLKKLQCKKKIIDL